MMIRAACFLIAALAFSGCKSGGDSNYPVKVSGKVTYNGTTVGGGTITFYTADGSPIQAPIGQDGTYVFTSLPEGTFSVTIETESINQKKQDYGGVAGGGIAGKYGKGGGGGAAVPKGKKAENSPAPEGAQMGEPTYVKIPAKYKDKTSSGLSLTLKKGDQKHNFDLTD